MFKVKQILGCVALSAAVSLPTQASQIVLDSFNYIPPLSMQADPINTVDSATVVSLESGATASYTLKWLSGAAADTVKGNVFNSGALSYDEEALANGNLEIAYAFPGPSLTLDFSSYSDLYLDILAIDGSGGFDVLFTLEDLDGTTISASYTATAAGMFLASIADMMPGANFDFSQVSKATAFFESAGDGDDFAIDEFGLTQVSAPSAVAILGLGLLVLGIRRRKTA